MPFIGERGVITSEMLARNVADMKKPVYYLAGPPAMVRGMTPLLVGMGVPKPDIRLEEFAGC